MTTLQLLHHGSVVSAQEARITLSGEADLTVLADLETALRSAELRPGRLIRIETADLTFTDVACFRRLVAFGHQAQQAGATVQIDHTPYLLRRLQHWLDTEGVLHLS